MRFPWQKADTEQQLDLLGDAPAPKVPIPASRAKAKAAPPSAGGIPKLVPTPHIDEDPANPRTEFPDAKVTELADDIRQRGILEPLVVHPANEHGRYLLHFGAMRLRAAVLAGLPEVPVVIRDAPADRYAQVAENLKRHSLSPLDLARFIRTDHPNTQEIFGRLDGWAGSMGMPGLFAHTGLFSQYVIGSAELVASTLLLIGLIPGLCL